MNFSLSSRQKYVDFYRSIALNLSKLRSTETSAATNGAASEQTNVEEAKRIANDITGTIAAWIHRISDVSDGRSLVEDNSREIVQSACRSIGSVKDNEFDVRFNPDVFQPHVNLNQTVGKSSTVENHPFSLSLLRSF